MDSGTSGGNFVLQNGKITTLGAPNFLFLSGRHLPVSSGLVCFRWKKLTSSLGRRCYTPTLLLVVLLPGVLQKTIFYKRSNSYRARRLLCQLPILLIMQSGAEHFLLARYVHRNLQPPVLKKARVRERPSSANNTWLFVHAADLIMRFGGKFPTKRQKYGTAKQLNARRTHPTNNPASRGGLSIKRHFQPSFGSAAESEMRRHAEISPMPLLILLLRQGCHPRKIIDLGWNILDEALRWRRH